MANYEDGYMSTCAQPEMSTVLIVMLLRNRFTIEIGDSFL